MAEEQLGDDVLSELDKIIQMEGEEGVKALQDYDKKVKAKKTKKSRPKASASDQEKNKWIADVVDETISDGYIYSGAERQTQQAEAWRRYFRERYGNETDGFSEYTSPMIQTQVNQTRAFITEQYFRNSAPIIKFRPEKEEDADEANLATEYVNHIFRHKLDGHNIIDQTVFNAALLKMCPVRVYMKEKRSSEPLTFTKEGKQEEVEEALAKFIVANDLQDVVPSIAVEDEKEDTFYVDYEWPSETIVESYPCIEVISPENFFISRQAESLESAKVIAKITNMMLSDIKEMFPDAPALNGYGKKDEMFFWEQLQSDYQTWYSETTWFAKWSHDSLQYFEQYDNQNDDSAGLGTKQLFVVDAEIYLDQGDTSEAKLCHVVKAGNNILYKKEISERSFLCGSLIPTANRWLGIGLWDLLEQESREEANLTRAFSDAAVQAAHPNLAFDPGVYEEDSIYERGPDTTFKVKIGAVPQAGVKPLEVVQFSGPDPSVLQAVQHFKAQSAEATGVGSGFAGADSAEISDMRMDKETAKAITNNSTLQLNFMARNYADFLCSVLVKVLNTAIKGGATSKLLEIQNAWKKVEPVGMKPKSDFILNADIGVNDAKEKLDKANAIMQAVGLLQGTPDPETGQALGVTAELLPSAGYEIGKLILEAHGAKDLVEKVFVMPQTMENPQVQGAIQNAISTVQQQAQQQMQALTQQVTEQVTNDVKVQEAKFNREVKSRELDIKEREIEGKNDADAFKSADDAVKEERYDEQQATDKAIKLKELELKELEIKNKHEIELAKIKLDKEGMNKSGNSHKSMSVT